MKKYNINTTNYYSRFMRKKGTDFSDVVSISRTSPDWFTGDKRIELAPTWNVLQTYKKSTKQTKDKQKYTMDYIGNFKKSKIDCLELVEYLNNKTLVCYEEPSEFCHRFLLIEYLQSIFNIDSVEV